MPDEKKNVHPSCWEGTTSTEERPKEVLRVVAERKGCAARPGIKGGDRYSLNWRKPNRGDGERKTKTAGAFE